MRNDGRAETPGDVAMLLVGRLAAIRRIDPSSIDAHASFHSLGVDSLDAITLLGEVENHFGIKLDIAEMFDHPTPVDLARLVVARLEADQIGHGRPGASDSGGRPGHADRPSQR